MPSGIKRTSESGGDMKAKRTKPANASKAQANGNDKSYPLDPKFLPALFKIDSEKFGYQYLDQKAIFVARRSNKALDVWRGLIKHGIQSCPVVLQTDIHLYYGIVDLQDALHFILTQLGNERALEEKKTLAELAKGVEKLEEGLVKDIMAHPLCRKNPFHPVCAKYSALSAIELLAREPHLHRVPVVDNLQDRKIVNVITQSLVLRWLADNMNLLGERAKKPIASCRGFLKPVFTCLETDTTVSAFKKMTENKVSGLAIVDDTGRLKGALSCRDIRALGSDMHFFWRLGQTVKNFIRRLRDMSDTAADASSEERRPRTIQKCIPSDTLGDAIRQMAEFKLHKLYLVDTPSDRQIQGVVSLRDVLKELISM